jgi:tetratricopeptide (TPR) repeat protein
MAPENVDILMEIGNIYYELDDCTKVMEYIEKVLNVDPSHFEALNLAAEIKKREVHKK